METFPITMFRFGTKRPETGQRMQLGGSYVYTEPPSGPIQRVFELKIPGLQYFLDQAGLLDLTQEVHRNMAVLEAFYEEHQLHKSFLFDHPVYGQITCKFNAAMPTPQGIPDGNGMVEDLDINLIEIP